MDDNGGEHADPPPLSQLIYSQSVHYPHAVSADAVAAGMSKQPQSAIDEFYGIRKTSRTVSEPPAERQMRRRRGKRRFDSELYLESQEQANERQRRKRIYVERSATKTRWQERMVDVRNEVDEGGVFDRMVRTFWSSSRRSDEALASEQSLELFWEQGLRAPLPVPGIPNPSHVIIRRQQLPPAPKCKNSHPMSKAPKNSVIEFKHMVQRKHLWNCPVSGVFFHQGAVAKVVARYLMTAYCVSNEEQNKYLRTLFKINPNLRSEAILREAAHHGWNFQTFLENSWNNRNLAAELLLTYKTSLRLSTQRRAVFEFEQSRQNRVLASLSSFYKEECKLDQDMDSVASKEEFEDFEMGAVTLVDGLVENEGEEPQLVSSFRFLCGAVPPMPMQPIDIANHVFGIEDPHRNAVRLGRIKPETGEITLATLLTRVASAKIEGFLQDHQNVQLFLKILRTRNKLNKTLCVNKYNNGIDLDVPAVDEYHAWMQYCRYTANQRFPIEVEPRLEETSYGDDTDVRSMLRAKAVAEEMSFVLEETQNRSSVNSFAGLHLIVAKCSIARVLPDDAANVFASGDHKTPFHNMRRTLEFMESKSQIADNYGTNDLFATSNMVSAALLEHVLYEAAKIVSSKCLLVSEDIYYHAWLVSLRFSCLLLCSGIQIGGPVVRYPSFRNELGDIKKYFARDHQMENLSYEVRQCLPKFEETRLQAAEALKTFLRNARKQGETRPDGLVIAVLEWHQPIALIVGPEKKGPFEGPEKVWREIRALYSHHVLALDSMSMARLEVIKDNDSASRNHILHHLALTLENDPSDVRNWRRLVQELGDLGESTRRCQKCNECKFLRRGFFFNHEKKQNPSWWGRKRVSWWKTHILALPPLPYCKAATIYSIGRQVEEKIRLVGLPQSSEKECDAFYEINLNWLRHIVRSLEKRQAKVKAEGKQSKKIPPAAIRSQEVHPLLPHSINKSVSPNDTELSLPIPNLIDNDETLEVICYKVFLSVLVYGPDDSAVAQGVWLLAFCSFAAGVSMAIKNPMPFSSQDSWECLIWLASRGLFVSKSILSFYENCIRDEVSKSKTSNRCDFPNEAKEALQLGVRCFGSKSLITIRDNVPFFNSWDQQALRALLVAMKANGELREPSNPNE